MSSFLKMHGEKCQPHKVQYGTKKTSSGVVVSLKSCLAGATNSDHLPMGVCTKQGRLVTKPA